jgi:hypothetical protein
MCTFENEHSIQVCDVAIGQVRAELDRRFPGLVTYVHEDGQPTRVIADSTVPPAGFKSGAELAIERAQLSDRR